MSEDIGLNESDRSEEGFKRLLIAVHFLWAYPKNAAILASTFSICKQQVEGENLWQWVRIIAALKKHKVIWPSDRYNDPESQIFIVTVDGVDFRCFENRHHAT